MWENQLYIFLKNRQPFLIQQPNMPAITAYPLNMGLAFRNPDRDDQPENHDAERKKEKVSRAVNHAGCEKIKDAFLTNETKQYN